MRNLKRKPTHPGEILNEDFLKPLGLSQTRLAREVNTTFRTVNEIVNEKRNISAEMAIKLSRYFGTSAELWLSLQNQYDIYRIKTKKHGILERIRPCGRLHKKVA
ncbi:MAG: HigA family addiction module antidote protein [Deltaproteobacteria bacterium]|nr:HigA family addiction module antidote protein [Deltaproteobacteria bacterium]MBI5810515.1 HigA family addiction module antidote protein [Deltaproteobacteria bacterium]